MHAHSYFYFFLLAIAGEEDEGGQVCFTTTGGVLVQLPLRAGSDGLALVARWNAWRTSTQTHVRGI